MPTTRLPMTQGPESQNTSNSNTYQSKMMARAAAAKLLSTAITISESARSLPSFAMTKCRNSSSGDQSFMKMFGTQRTSSSSPDSTTDHSSICRHWSTSTSYRTTTRKGMPGITGFMLLTMQPASSSCLEERSRL